jgi:hypothetical protein
LDNPVIPNLRNDQLTLDEARNDPDFGEFVPGSVPARLNFESANRFINQDNNNLRILWHSLPNRGMDSITWQISKTTEHDLARIVFADEREKYEMAQYPIPWADSVPEELREVVLNPVFRAEELTLEIIQARAYSAGRRGSDAVSMQFSVLYGDVVVEVSAGGLTPEEVWEMFTG